MKLHHLLHEYFMKPQLRSFQLAEAGAGAGPWPLLPRAGGDRDTGPAPCLLPAPGCPVASTAPPVLPRLPWAGGQQRPCLCHLEPGGTRPGAGWEMQSAGTVCGSPEKWCFPCSASPGCSSSSSPSGPACSLEHSFPTAASLADAITNLSPLPALG